MQGKVHPFISDVRRTEPEVIFPEAQTFFMFMLKTSLQTVPRSIRLTRTLPVYKNWWHLGYNFFHLDVFTFSLCEGLHMDFETPKDI